MKSNPLWVSDPGRTVDSIPMDLLTFREDKSCPVSQELTKIDMLCSVQVWVGCEGQQNGRAV